MNFRKSLGFRLLCLSVILLAIPILVDVIIFFEKRYASMIKQAQDYLVEESLTRAFPFSEIEGRSEKMLLLFDHFLSLSTAFPKEGSKQLNAELKNLSLINDYYGMILLKPTESGNYKVVASSLSRYLDQEMSPFSKEFDPFSEEAKKKGYVTALVNDHDKGKYTPFLVIAKGIYSADGKPAGVLAIVDTIAEQLSFLLKVDQHPYAVNFALLLPSSVVFASSDPDLTFNYFHALSKEERELFLKEEPMAENRLSPHPLTITKQDPNSSFINFRFHDKTQLGFVQKLPGTSLSLLAYSARADVARAPFNDFIPIYGNYFLVLIIGTILTYFVVKRITKPITQLYFVMQKIQEGDLKKRYERDFVGFEINTLGEIFNEMIDALIEKKRLATEERLERELLTKELKLGQNVQRSLLPQAIPQYQGVDLAEAFIPALEVGGDFYDMFIKENNKLVVAVADASGKGVQACCYSLILKNMLRTFAQKESSVTEAMFLANNLFCEDTAESGMFVTVFMAQYDASTRQLDFYSYGHNPPLLYHSKDKKVEMLDHVDMAMGFLKHEERKQFKSLKLELGDILVMYSDGITEAHNTYKQLFGEERLMNLLSKSGALSAQELASSILEEVARFTTGAKQHDDITLLVMKVK